MIDHEYVKEFLDYVKQLPADDVEQLAVMFRETLSPPKKIDGTRCRFAEDTGKRAFPAAPCRGNRIICHKIEGHTSYTKACSPEKCKFYEEG